MESNGPFIPKISRLLTAATSTNDVAVAAVTGREKPTNGAVFRALDQSAGRGQGGNGWHATPFANLTFSVVAYPGHLPLDRLFALNQVAALSVADAITAFLPTELGTRVRVKWPNDVYVGARKIAGILIQNGLQSGHIAWSVIGVGLNVNEVDFPETLRRSATSLRLLLGHETDPGDVLTGLLDRLRHHYAMTDRRLLGVLDRNYHALLYRLDVPSSFFHVETGRVFTGTIRGVDAAGCLQISMLGGRVRSFALREVRLV